MEFIFDTSAVANKTSSSIPHGTNLKACLRVLKIADFCRACLMHIDICTELTIPVSEQDVLYVSETCEKRL